MSGFNGFFGSLLEKIGLGSTQAKPVAKPSNVEDIKSWLANRIATKLKKDLSTIQDQIPFAQLGLDSLGAINITTDIEKWLEIEIDPTILYQYTNITELSDHLAEKLKISTCI